MNNKYILLLIILFLIGCDSFNRNKVECIDEAQFVGLDSSIHFAIPNIIVNDDLKGQFAYNMLKFDGNVGMELIPEQMSFKVYDQDENLIFENTEVTRVNSNFYLWDGTVDSIPYSGIVVYELLLLLDDDRNIRGIGKVQVTSCAELRECMNSNCNIFDCRFYNTSLNTCGNCVFPLPPCM